MSTQTDWPACQKSHTENIKWETCRLLQLLLSFVPKKQFPKLHDEYDNI